MSHAYFHSLSSVKLFKGSAPDYLPIHEWLDQSKIAWADCRHRACLHNSFGIFLCEKFFGKTITNSDGKAIPVRLIAEQHIKEDLGGKIPSIQDWLGSIHTETWMNRGYRLNDGEVRDVD